MNKLLIVLIVVIIIAIICFVLSGILKVMAQKSKLDDNSYFPPVIFDWALIVDASPVVNIDTTIATPMAANI
ncbi:MAG: hypothetical protein ACRD8Z_08675 [Nitrososphaeraceae archaeon]